MKNTWIWIVVVVIVGVGAVLLFQNMQQASMLDKSPSEESGEVTTIPGTDSTATTTTSGATTTEGTLPAPITIVLSDTGFSPAHVTVSPGTTVTFLNQSKSKMNVASGSHPGHEGYDGTGRSAHCASGYTGAVPFDQCTAGTSYSFTFTKAGSWPYHNHFNASQYGTVEVK